MRTTGWIWWAGMVVGLVAIGGVVSARGATLNVVNLNDSGAGSLRQALTDAVDGDHIDFDDSLSGTLTLTSGTMTLAGKSVTIIGPASGDVEIDGNGSRMFAVANGTLTAEMLTFRNGMATGGHGGAILVAGGGLDLASCRFFDNAATGADGADGGFGGAVYATGSVVRISGCQFQDNTATGARGLPLTDTFAGGGGGGAGLGGAICVLNGELTILNSSFWTNGVTGGQGGVGGPTDTFQDGGHGGGPAGGEGGITGSNFGKPGGLYSGGGGGRGASGGGPHGGPGGFAGGGGGAGAYNNAVGGKGGRYAGDGGDCLYSYSGGGGGGAGLGGAIFVGDSQVVLSNLTVTANEASGGLRGGAQGAGDGSDGLGAGGGFFAYLSPVQQTGSVDCDLNAADVHPDVYVDNGYMVSPASGPSTGGNSITLTNDRPVAITNVLVGGAVAPITDSGAGWATATVPAAVAIGEVPVAAQTNGSALAVLAGTYTYERSAQAALVFTPASPQPVGTTNGLSVQGGSGTGVVSYAVTDGPGLIVGGTNLAVTAGTGTVTVVATKAQDDLYLATSVTATVAAAQAAWNHGQQDLGGGWWRLGWFGDYAPMGPDGWVWHNQHGFVCIADMANADDIWMYTADMGWLWTSTGDYPFLYRDEDSTWLWYSGRTNPRWFYNFTTEDWESFDP